MKLLTANIAHGLRFGEFSTVEDSALKTLALELDADVVCLQEVDFKKERSSFLNQIEVLKAYGNFMTGKFFPALIGEPGLRSAFRMPTKSEIEVPPADSYGIGILSRYPILDVETIQLSGSRLSLPMPFMINSRTRWRAIPDEPRILVRITVDSPLGEVDVVTTHLSFIPTRAISQLFTSRHLIKARPCILAGDLNLAPRVTSRVTGLQHVVLAPTYPKPRPRAQLDHILISKELVSVNAGVKALSISDHLALVAEVAKR